MTLHLAYIDYPFVVRFLTVSSISERRLLLPIFAPTSRFAMVSFEEKHDAFELENIVIDEKAAAAGEHPPIDPLAEKKLLRKVDLHVIPVLFVLFLMAFLDRTNIGLTSISLGMKYVLIMTGR